MTPPAPPEPVAAVVFDLDDTLFLERDYVRSGYRAVAETLSDEPERAAEIAAWMWQRFCRGDSGGAFDAAGEHFGLGLSPEKIAQLVHAYRRHRPAIAPVAEAVAVLDALAGRVRLGLLSDGFLPAQQLKLDAIGLADRFEEVLFTESMGRECWKPSPAGFENLAARLTTPHAACAYVGDNPAKDFVAPNALGWLTVQWRREGQVHAAKAAPPGGRARHVVRSGEELLAVLAPPPSRP